MKKNTNRPPGELPDENWQKCRAVIIRQAEQAIARDKTVSGVTVLIPGPNGAVEELYISRRRRGIRR